VHHEVRGVGFDDCTGAGLAYYVGLCAMLKDYTVAYGCVKKYHVATELCRSHCGEIGRAGVVFATANNCYAA
jgi:hypothetical protein